jgi:hypothetical protein
MTVVELIEHLHTFPADARVIVPNFHKGYDDVTKLHAEPVKLAHNALLGHIEGPYKNEIDLMNEDEQFVPDETAVVIDSD